MQKNNIFFKITKELEKSTSKIEVLTYIVSQYLEIKAANFKLTIPSYKEETFFLKNSVLSIKSTESIW